MAEIDTILYAAAFGDDCARWPLPDADDPYRLWLRALAASGQGRYAGAEADLAVLLRVAPAGSPLVSLAHSARASFLRQLGWHTRARGHDGRAVAVAAGQLAVRSPAGVTENPPTHPTTDTTADPTTDTTAHPTAVEAMVDGLVGLAADALGVCRFEVSAALLARADRLPLVTTTPPYRTAIRRSWVGAELAMARADGETAIREASRAVALAEECGSVRHRVKSQVVLAAALCCAGRLDAAREVADSALVATEKFGLVPLRWALACLLADVGSNDHTATQISGIRQHSAELVDHRGGEWCQR